MTAHFTVERFLDEELCRSVRAAMDRGGVEPAEVLGDGITLAAEVRRAMNLEIDVNVLELVERRLDHCAPALRAYYGRAVGSREGASFLRYDEGGFYKTHRDRADSDSWPGAARRQIAVVVFLNSAREIDPSGSFSGGCLRLYPEDADVVEVYPRTGMLVAFPATVLHEVTVVRGGTRDTIVDWFY